MKRKTSFRRIRQPMDGNCFYHSISFLFNYYGMNNLTHEEIRKKVSDHYRKHGKRKRSKNILKLGVWADTDDVIATSNAFKVSIKVWETKNNMWITFGDFKKKVYLYNYEMIHFDALLRCKQT